MFGLKYKKSDLDFATWITLAQAIEATEKSIETTSSDLINLKKLLITIIKQKAETEKISGREINTSLDIISHTLHWDLNVDQDLKIDNDELFYSLLTSEFKSLMELPNIPREEIFLPLRDILKDYIELPKILDVEGASPEITVLLVLGVAIATLRDESGLDSRKNRKLRRDNACFWYGSFVIDWIYNFGDVEYLDRDDGEFEGEAIPPAPSPWNPLSW